MIPPKIEKLCHLPWVHCHVYSIFLAQLCYVHRLPRCNHTLTYDYVFYLQMPLSQKSKKCNCALNPTGEWNCVLYSPKILYKIYINLLQRRYIKLIKHEIYVNKFNIDFI